MGREDVLEGRFAGGYGGVLEIEGGKLLHITGGLRGFTSEDGGRSWSEPFELEGPEGAIEGHSSVGLTRLSSGALALHYSNDIVRSEGYRKLAYRWSVDEGASWSEEVCINPHGAIAWPHYDALIQSRSGRLILPVRQCFAHRAKETLALGAFQDESGGIYGHTLIPEMVITFIYFSDDEGRTWSQSEDELMLWVNQGYGNVALCSEPTVAQMSDGNLILFMRTTLGRIAQSVSEDDGETWSLVQLNSLCNSCSPPRIRQIPQTGDLHCVWNNVTIEENRRGFRRSRLSSAVSRDNAQTWECFRNLECCSALENIAEIKDPEEPKHSKQGEKFEGFPPGYVIYRYPNVFYTKDRVLFMYSYEQVSAAEGRVVGESDVNKPDNYCKLLDVPIDWVYG